jgi:lipopolysaccharide biosynthesis glycosyltransferase
MTPVGLAYVTAFDLNYLQSGAVLLGSLAQQLSPGQIVFVLTSDNGKHISEYLENLDSLKCVDLRIIEVPKRVSLLKTMIMNDLLHFSNAAIYRLYMEYLIPSNITKVIYLDSDMLIVDSLEELENSQSLFSAVIESDKMNYFNSGVFQTNLEYWRNENVLKLFQSYLNNNPDSLYKDQDALNFVFASKNQSLNPKFNCQVKLRNSFEEIAILHFSGTRKPWYASTPNNYYVSVWRAQAKMILGPKYKLTKRKFDSIRKILIILQCHIFMSRGPHGLSKKVIN